MGYPVVFHPTSQLHPQLSNSQQHFSTVGPVVSVYFFNASTPSSKMLKLKFVFMWMISCCLIKKISSISSPVKEESTKSFQMPLKFSETLKNISLVIPGFFPVTEKAPVTLGYFFAKK